MAMDVDFLNAFQVGSKMDTKKLVTALVDAEIAPKQSSLDSRTTKTEAQISGLATLKSTVQTLQSAFQNLDDNREFNFAKITSSDSATITTEVGSGVAVSGIHSVTVSALAERDILSTNTFSSSSADQNSGSAANFVFTVNGTQHTVALAAGGVSLDKLAEGVNAKTADSGVTARVVSTGTDQYRLLMEGQSGSTNGITINTDLPTTYASTAVTLTVGTAIGVGQTAAITVDGTTFTTAALSAGATAGDIGDAFSALSVTGWTITDNNSGVVTFTKNAAYSKSGETGQSVIATADAPTVTIGGSGSGAVTAAAVDSSAGVGFALADVTNKLKTAQDASLTANGLAVTRSSNKISDLIPGVTLNLNKTTSSAVNVNVSRDLALAKETITTMVSAVNLFESTLKSLSNSVDGDLANDSTVVQIKDKLKQMFYSNSSKPGTTIKSIIDMGLSYDKAGSILVDESKLNTALTTYYDEVKDFFSGGTDDHSAYDSEDKSARSTLTFSGGLNAADTATITIPATYASTAVTLTAGSAIGANQTAAITIDGTTFTTAALSANSTIAQIGDAFSALSVSGWTITDDNSGGVTFTKNSSYSKSGETGQSVIATADAPTVTIGSAGSGSLTASAVDSVAGVAAVTVAVDGSTGTYSSATTLATAFATAAAAANSGVGLTGYTVTASGTTILVTSTATGADVGAIAPTMAVIKTGGNSSQATSPPNITSTAAVNEAGSAGLKRGLAGDIVSLMESYLAYNGSMDTMRDQFNAIVAQTETDQTTLDDRKASIEARYTKQFTAMNRIMEEMNALKEYLDAQLDALPNNNKD